MSYNFLRLNLKVNDKLIWQRKIQGSITQVVTWVLLAAFNQVYCENTRQKAE